MSKPLPSAVRFYLRSTVGSLMGDQQSEQAPFTEKDMTAEELAALRIAITNAKKDGRNFISYEDYPTKSAWWENRDSVLGELDALMADPARSAMFSLGMARFDENGNIYDSYDFAASPKQKITFREAAKAVMSEQGNNPRAVFNLIGNMAGLRSGTGRPIKISTRQSNE